MVAPAKKTFSGVSRCKKHHKGVHPSSHRHKGARGVDVRTECFPGRHDLVLNF